MTLRELRREIVDSKYASELNSFEFVFDFSYFNQKVPLKGLSAVYEFVLKQQEGWEKLGIGIPDLLKSSVSYFSTIKDQIIVFSNLHISKSNHESILGYLHLVINAIASNGAYPMKYNMPEVEFLLKLNDEYPNSFSTAFDFLTNKNNRINIINRDSLIGANLSYEFLLNGKSEITKRGKFERNSLKSVRRDLDKNFSEAETYLIEHLSEIKSKYEDFALTIDSFKSTKEETFNEWFNLSKTQFTSFNDLSKEKIESLETTYNELLSLSKPALYWRRRATELKSEGRKFLEYLIAAISLGVILLFSLLWITPEGIYSSFFNNDKSTAIRWSIIFVTFISFLAYGIRTLTKVTFSTYHLARDAEERDKLTYFYLSMLKESAIEKEDRSLIIQSLFSRAETGLLKDESTPSMPGSSSLFEKFNK